MINQKAGKLVNCMVCGKEIYKKLHWFNKVKHHFCSSECYGKSKVGANKTGKRIEGSGQKRKGKIFPCAICGKEIYRALGMIKQNNYCSKACANQGLCGETIKIKCQFCGKEMIRKKGYIKYEYQFCDRVCSAAYRKGKERTNFTPKRGEDNPAWKGGIAGARCVDFKSDEYRQFRKTVFERDGYRCVICGEVGGDLNAHHIKKYSEYPLLRYEANNGITLCRKCHYIQHRKNSKDIVIIEGVKA